MPVNFYPVEKTENICTDYEGDSRLYGKLQRAGEGGRPVWNDRGISLLSFCFQRFRFSRDRRFFPVIERVYRRRCRSYAVTGGETIALGSRPFTDGSFFVS